MREIRCIKSFAYCKETVDKNVPFDGKAIQIPRLRSGSSDSVLRLRQAECEASIDFYLGGKKKIKNPCTLLMRAHGVHLINGSFMRLPQFYFFPLPLLWFFHTASPCLPPQPQLTALKAVQSFFDFAEDDGPVCHDGDSEYIMFIGKDSESE